MKLVSLLTISAVLYFFTGVGLLLAPLILSSVPGAAFDRQTALASQILGAALIGFGWANWALRASGDLIARRAVTFGNLMFHSVAALVVLVPQLQGLLYAGGWMLIGTHAALAFAFGYIIFVRRNYIEVRFDEW